MRYKMVQWLKNKSIELFFWLLLDSLSLSFHTYREIGDLSLLHTVSLFFNSLLW